MQCQREVVTFPNGIVLKKGNNVFTSGYTRNYLLRCVYIVCTMYLQHFYDDLILYGDGWNLMDSTEYEPCNTYLNVKRALMPNTKMV